MTSLIDFFLETSRYSLSTGIVIVSLLAGVVDVCGGGKPPWACRFIVGFKTQTTGKPVAAAVIVASNTASGT